MRKIVLLALLVFLAVLSGCFKMKSSEIELSNVAGEEVFVYVEIQEISALTPNGKVELEDFEPFTVELFGDLNSLLKAVQLAVGDTLRQVKMRIAEATCYIDSEQFPCSIPGNQITVVITPYEMDDLSNVFYTYNIRLDKRGGRVPFYVINPVIRITGFAVNNPPSTPANPSPSDNAVNAPLKPILSWSCSDPDGDSLLYDIYLSEPNNETTLSPINTNHSLNYFNVTTSLQENSTYYWQMVAKDGRGGETAGPVWSFTTSDTVIPEGSFLLKFSLAQPEQASFALQDDRELSLVYTNIDEEDSSGRFVLVDGTNSVQLNKGGTYVLGIAERYDGVITVLGLIGDAELGLHTLPVSYAANDIIDLGNLILNGGVFTSELITGQDLCNILGHSYETLAAFGQFDMTLKKFLNPDINKNGLYDREEDPETNWTFATQTGSKWFEKGDIVFDDVDDPIKIPVEEFNDLGIKFAIGLRNASCLPTSVETSVPGRLTLPDGLGQVEVPGGERESGFHWEPYHWETGWGEIWFEMPKNDDMTPPYNGNYVLEIGDSYECVYYFDNFDFLTPDNYLEGFIFALSKAIAYPNGRFKSISWRWYRMLGDGTYVLATPEQVRMAVWQYSFFMHEEKPDGYEAAGFHGELIPDNFGYDYASGGTIPLTEYDSWLYKNMHSPYRYVTYDGTQYDKGNNTYAYLFRADIIGEPTDPSPAEGAADVSLQPTLSWESFTDGETLEYTVQISISREDFDNYIFFETTTDSTSITIPPENELNFSPIYYWRVFPSMEDPLHPGETITYDFQCSIWSFSTVHPGNYPPSVPSNPDPTDGATEVMLRSSLSWTSSDPDNDPVVYDVRFGTPDASDTIPLLVGDYEFASIQIFDFVSLHPETTYYWQIVAKDGRGGEAVGPVWSFTTLTSGVEIFFPDPNLDQRVREYIGKNPGEPIYSNEVLGIEHFDAAWRNISDITGIGNLVNVRHLNINENNITDITPLASLTQLEYLNIETNNITDISVLPQLPNLRALSTGRNPIADFSPLESISGLLSLALVDLSLTDSSISFLSNLPQLIELGLSQNQITDLSPIQNLTNLGMIDLGRNPVSDLTPLQGLLNLEYLFAYDNAIQSLAPLENLDKLRYLLIWNNLIDDLSPISNLTSLVYLRCSDNLITDLSPLANLMNLEELYVSSNIIAAIGEMNQQIYQTESFPKNSLLFEIPTMTYPRSADNKQPAGIFSIQALEGLTSLRVLDLSNNIIEDISALENLVNLEWLSLYNNEIRDITPLVNNPGIGEGDYIDVRMNYLDLTPDSTDMNNIQTLQSRVSHIEYEPQMDLDDQSYVRFKPAPGEKIMNVNIVFFRENESTSTGADKGTLDTSHLESGTWGFMAKVETLSPEGVKLYLLEGNISVPGANIIELSSITDRIDITLIDENGLELSDSSLVTARFFLSDFYDTQSVTSYAEVRKLYGNIASVDMIHFIDPYYGRHWFAENLFIPSVCTLSLENCATLNFSSGIDKRDHIDFAIGYNFRGKANYDYYSNDITLKIMPSNKVGYHYGAWNNSRGYYTSREEQEFNAGETININVLEGLHIELHEISEDATKLEMEQGQHWISGILKDSSGGNIEVWDSIPFTGRLRDDTNAVIWEETTWNHSDFGFDINLPGPGTYTLEISVHLLDFPSTVYENQYLTREMIIEVAQPIEIFFPDPNLEQVVREHIGKNPGEPIYSNEVLGIEHFDAAWRNISDITGIGNLVNVKNLHINENNISDISPLASLTQLEYLNIETNNISDISILTQLSNLQGLSTGRNPIIDISVVNQIPNLNSLALVGLNLEDNEILFLGANTNLQTIWLNQNNITDLTPLTSMVYLSSLDFSNNLVADLSPLQNLGHLTGIWCYSNQITSLEPLQYLTNLTAIFVGGNQITDLSPLAPLTQITHLECSSNQIADISPLEGLINLQWMSVSNNNIQGILPLVNNTGIDSGDYVDISYNLLDLTPDGTDMTNISLLLQRGVDLAYEPQK